MLPCMHYLLSKMSTSLLVMPQTILDFMCFITQFSVQYGIVYVVGLNSICLNVRYYKSCKKLQIARRVITTHKK